MSSTGTVQSTTQTLTFAPQWFRSSSTSDSAASVPSSSTSSSGNVFKFSATRYRYSKDEILALRTNVSNRLSDDIRNEIVKNLEEVEHVFRPNILEPLTLTKNSANETIETNSTTRFKSGRGAANNNNNGSNSRSDTRKNHRGGFTSNGRMNSRENGSRPSDDRGPTQPSRSGRGGSRQTSDDWRRTSRGDDDEKKDQSEDPSRTLHHSASWAPRSGHSRNASGSIDHRTKSSEKFSTNSSECNQSRDNGYRAASTMSDRNYDIRHSHIQQDEMPEWADDSLDGDIDSGTATFEEDGTYIRSTSVQQSNTDQRKEIVSSSSMSDLSLSQPNATLSQPKDEVKSETPTPIVTDTAAHVNLPNVLQTNVSPPVQKATFLVNDDADHHDLATNMVELTLAEDPEETPRNDIYPPVRSQLQKQIPSPVTNNPISEISSKPVIFDVKQWFYKDPQNTIRGPFSSDEMERWWQGRYFPAHLPVKRLGENEFTTIQQLWKELGRSPFSSDVQISQSHRAQVPTQLSFQRSISSNASTSVSSPLYGQSPSSNPLNDPAIIHSQQQQQRTLSSTKSMHSNPYEEIQQFHRHSSPQNNVSNYFSSNSQTNTDIMHRLAQAMDSHNKQQDKFDFERLKRQELRQQYEQQQMQYKKPSNVDMQRLFALQQAQIEAQKVENVRRYQQHYQELSQQRNLYSPSDTPHWTQRLPSSYQHDQTTQQFLDFQKQQEQERNFRENVASLTQQSKTRSLSQQTSWSPGTNPSAQFDLRNQQQHLSSSGSNWDEQFSSQIQPQHQSSSLWENSNYFSSTTNKNSSTSTNTSANPKSPFVSTIR